MGPGTQQPQFLCGGEAQNSVFPPQPAQERQEENSILQEISPKMHFPCLWKFRADNSPKSNLPSGASTEVSNPGACCSSYQSRCQGLVRPPTCLRLSLLPRS